MSEVLNGLMQVRGAFLRAGLQPPTVMLLESREEGMRFLSAIQASNALPQFLWPQDLGRVVEMADGSAWMECKVMNIAVRWPANRIAMPDGTWSYV